MTTPEPQFDAALCAQLIERWNEYMPLSVMEQLRALLAERARHTAALKELVRLKAMKDGMQAIDPNWPEYERLKPLAWAEARRLVGITINHPTPQEVLEHLRNLPKVDEGRPSPPRNAR